MSKEIFSKEPQKYVINLAQAFKKIPEFKKPEWADFIKTGSGKKRPPENDNFWHIRAASILRQLYIKGVVGVGKLRTRYGTKKNRGGRPSRFYKASGKIIRTILQQAEQAGLVEQLNRIQHGRRLTKKGRDFLDSIEVEKVPGINLKKTIEPEEKETAEQQLNKSEKENQKLNKKQENGEQESKTQKQ